MEPGGSQVCAMFDYVITLLIIIFVITVYKPSACVWALCAQTPCGCCLVILCKLDPTLVLKYRDDHSKEWEDVCLHKYICQHLSARITLRPRPILYRRDLAVSAASPNMGTLIWGTVLQLQSSKYFFIYSVGCSTFICLF